MRIGVTGGDGFIGWHLRCRCLVTGEIEFVPLSRDVTTDLGHLAASLRALDAVVHLAGVNRGDDGEVEHGNVTAAETLVTGLVAAEFRGPVIYASSIHAGHDNPYGRGKAAAGRVLQSWSDQSGARLATLVVPHVFGEHGRPHYNSAVATFAYSIAQGKTCDVNHDGGLELIHVGEVCDAIILGLKSGSGEQRLGGQAISVGEVFNRLADQWAAYSRDELPELEDKLALNLFNTLRSYAYPDFYPRRIELRSDPRGSLAEVVKCHSGGQMFFSTTRPGVIRGNHFHVNKVERFCVVRGRARIEIRRLFSGEIKSFDVAGDTPAYVDMPVLHTHNIRNVGDGELLTLFWSNEIFDPAAPDTCAHPVRLAGEGSL